MRVLVTGGAGFIASHVADGMIAAGHEVAVLDNLSTGFRENVPKDATFFEVDIRDAAGVDRVISAFRPDVIDHHAAQMDVRKSLVDPVFDAESNIVGSLNVILSGQKHGVKKYIYISTGGAVYGEPSTLPVTEQHPVHPECAYGISKHTVEHYLELYRILYDLRYTVLRYPNVYGPRQSPHGEAGVIAIFAGLFLEGKVPTIYGDGEQLRDYVFVSDVVKANLQALEAGDGEILNIGSSVGTSVNTLFRELAELANCADSPNYAPPRTGEIRATYLDASRAATILGWKPEVSLSEGLRKTWTWNHALHEKETVSA
ncbi:MAG: NAD-dependent epimerase/dehydratase family protein [Calditrichaeota bacterium]|nr:NAD-dependent epimerase/dehydratase family protein [Calditrichota bacterium]MCB9391563.1 NAD-dependent epimerase/dehydratase family protein [Calditrichota bacterium]